VLLLYSSILGSPIELNVLFLHHNAPAQFKFLLAELVRRGIEPIFISQKINERIPGVKHFIIRPTSESNPSKKNPPLSVDKLFLSSLLKLKKRGFSPDIIISHSGFKCGLYAKSVFSTAKLICYLEWWFTSENINDILNSSQWLKLNDIDFIKSIDRNMLCAYELIQADFIISPTSWQLSHLPNFFLSKPHKIIHEGFDPQLLHYPPVFKSATPNITYATRGAEAIRGFPEFIEAACEICKHNKRTTIHIIGDDRICYCGSPPAQGSYHKWAEYTIHNYGVSSQFRFYGYLPRDQYLKVLSRSNLHVYLTSPFVPSWSLLDALAMGLPVLASSNTSLDEFLPHAIPRVDHSNVPNLIEAITNSLLITAEELIRVSNQSRLHISQNFNRSSSVDAWLSVISMLVS